MTANDIRPLDGVRVLELGNYIAAPTAGRMLADFGAEVIKVERPVTGDELRNWRLYSGRHLDAVPHDQPQQEVDRAGPEDRGGPADRARPRPRSATSCWRTSGPAPWRSGASDPRTLDRVQPGPGDHPHLRVRPDRPAVRSGPGSPPSPRPSAACVNSSATPTGRRCGSACRSATRSPGIYAAFGAVMALFQRERVESAVCRSGSSTSP